MPVSWLAPIREVVAQADPGGSLDLENAAQDAFGRGADDKFSSVCTHHLQSLVAQPHGGRSIPQEVPAGDPNVRGARDSIGWCNRSNVVVGLRRWRARGAIERCAIE